MRLFCYTGLVIAVAGALSHHLPLHALEILGHLHPWVLTSTLLLAMIALLRQFWFVGWMLTAMAAYHLVFTLPYLTLGAFQSPAPHQDGNMELRVLQFNINANNPHYDALAHAIEAAEADILVLCEANVHVLDRLSHLHELYPYRIEVARWPRQTILGVSGTVLWSRHPFLSSRSVELAQGNIQMCVALISIAETELSVYALHLLAPRTESQIEQRDQGMQELAQLIADDSQTNILLIGDLNQSIWTPAGRRLLEATRLKSILKGRIFMPTWPSFTYPFGIAIDHILYRGALSCKGVNSLDGNGSDHRMLVADFTLIPANSTEPK